MVRIAAKTTPVLHLGRVHEVHWLGRSEAHLLAARNLGVRADALAARAPLPSSEETRELLSNTARNTPLDGLPAERLVSLAAEASRTARPSARLELYQRGLPAARAIKLVAAALPAEVIRDALVELVRRRYPDAEPLPEHRELDPLMAEVGFDWDETRRCYRRKGAFPTTSSATDQTRTIVTPRPGARALTTEDEEQRSEFETRIRPALEQRALRVLEVNANYADRLVERLRKRFQLTPRSIEGELLAALRRRMTEDGVEPEMVYDADRRGPGGEDWRPLAALAAAASDDVLRDLRSAREPMLLTRPGLLPRYGLGDFLKGILDAAQADDFPALFLVVPAAEGQGAAPIDGGSGVAPLPVPVTAPSQRLRVPRAWLEAPQ